MNKEKVVPEIRFEGFSDNWDTKELSKVTERVVRKNVDLVSMNPLTISAQVGLISQLDYYNFQVASKNLSNYYLLSKGDFAYNKSYSAGYPVGAIKRLDYYEKGLLSTLYIIFRPTNVNSEFLKHYYESNYWHKGIYDIAEEGARNHGLLNVAPIQFFETHLNLPVSDLEQSRIGNLFEKIEGNIKKREQEIFKLKNFKKAMLQKMFPKEGGIVPEVRFKGFEEEWKETTLGDNGDTFTGLSGKTKEDFGHGEGRFVPYTNVFNNPITDIDSLEKVEMDRNQNEVQYGDIFFTTSSETPEEVGMASVWKHDTDNIYLNSFCFGYRPTEKFNLDFIAYLLHSPYIREQFQLLAQGISRFNISKTKAMDIKLCIPSKGEQELIGSYFNSLQKNIYSKQAELDKLKQFKQAMLDKMFV